ncbi:MAG: Frizzy aggregation protein FrzB [Myxococcaceae bacterium]|nr:Frizzy aggregation protein FrzB [Myxococcaceae bacterium]
MSELGPQADEVQIVLFEIGGTRYGADMTQVRRIGRATDLESVGVPLGSPSSGQRALIFAVPGGGEVCLPIDGVLGVHPVPRDALRRLPLAVGLSPFIIGAWLDRDQTVLLVDLLSTNPFRTEATHA